MNLVNKRIFGLDVLRAIAIALVVFSHCTFLLYPDGENTIIVLIRIIGAVGVDLFFVLSGFLIGGILLKMIQQGKHRFSDLITFWKRRWFRTLPNYFLILLLNILMFYFLGNQLPNEIGSYFVFLQNFSSPHPNFFTEAWSLSIEEFAYLLLPLFFYISFYFMKMKKKKQLFLWTTVLSILGLALLKGYYYFNVPVDSYKYWSTTFRKVIIYRIDAIYFGFLVVYFTKEYSEILKRFKGTLAVVGMSLFLLIHLFIYTFHLLPETHLGFYVFVYLQLVVVSLGMLFPYFSTFDYKGVYSKGIQFVSSRSYAIYLVNYSIVLLNLDRYFDLDRMLFFPKIILVLFFLFITLVLSELLYRFFEQPILKWRNKTFPS